MERFVFYLTDEDKRKLAEVAEVDNRSMGGALRLMINKAYDNLIINVPIIGSISSKGITIEEEIERA